MSVLNNDKGTPFQQMRGALGVIAFDERIAEDLCWNDPKALEQVITALIAVAKERNAMFIELNTTYHADAAKAEAAELVRLNKRLAEVQERIRQIAPEDPYDIYEEAWLKEEN